MDLGAREVNRTELRIDYDAQMRANSGSCANCGEKMPRPPAELQNSADIIVWLSEKYVEHRKLKHSNNERRRVPRD